MRVEILVSPLARSAYFAEVLDVACAELAAILPEAVPQRLRRGPLDLVAVDATEEVLPRLGRLSFAQALFAESDGALRVLEVDGGFALPEDLVWGTKYRGKTHELVTQLAINVGLAGAELGPRCVPQLLDPMAGHGTTLLWALRYGMDAFGTEIDGRALDALHLHVKKQCKLHRIKHQAEKGQVGKGGKHESGRFRRYRFGERIVNLLHGDGAHVSDWFQKKRYHLVVSDLPYGVQHRDATGARNPLGSVRSCAPAWVDRLFPGGTITLIFNSYQPRRVELVELFEGLGLATLPFAAPHRMSESIVRDVVVFKKPRD